MSNIENPKEEAQRIRDEVAREDTQQIMKDYLLTEQEAIDLKELKDIPMYGPRINN